MYELPKDQMSNTEQAILLKLRVWIIALVVVCVAAGVAIGAFLSGHPVVAQNETIASRAPEALSASFAEIAKKVEPAVVNIDTKTAGKDVADDEDDSKDSQSSTNPLIAIVPSYPGSTGFGYAYTSPKSSPPSPRPHLHPVHDREPGAATSAGAMREPGRSLAMRPCPASAPAAGRG